MNRSFIYFAVSLYIPAFFITLGFGLVSPVLPLYAQTFGVPYAMVALITTANALGRIICDIPLGALCDKLGRRNLAILGPLIVTVSAILCGLAQSFYELLFYRAITGIGMAMWMIARQAIVADSVDPSIRGRVMSTFMGINMVGMGTGPAVGGIIAEFWDYRAPFFFYAASTFVSLVACLILVREPATPLNQSKKNNPTLRVNLRQFINFLTFPILMTALANFMVHLRFATRTVLIPLFGNDVLYLSPGEIGLVLSASTFANLLMVVPGGFIVDRFGRKAGFVPSLILTGITFAVFPLSSDFMSAAFFSAIIGISQGIGAGATLTMAADLSPEGYRGLFLGFWNTIGDIGNAVGPVLLGLVGDYYGLTVSFYFIAALMFVNAGITHFFVKETLTKRAREWPTNTENNYSSVSKE